LEKITSATAEAPKLGKTAPSMKVNGNSIKHTAKAFSGILTAINMMEIGQMTKLMATAYTLMPMVPNTMANGKTTCSMGMVLKLGWMGLNSKVITMKARNTDKVSTYGVTGLSTREIGSTTKSTGEAPTNG